MQRKAPITRPATGEPVVSRGKPTKVERWPKYVHNAILALARYMEQHHKRVLSAEFDDDSLLFVHWHDPKSKARAK